MTQQIFKIGDVLNMGILFHSRQRERIRLDNNALELVKYYMRAEKIDNIDLAISNLIKKGYEYWLLEKKYGSEAPKDPKVWSESYWNLRASSGFVYYRLRLKDAIEEIKRLSITMSSILADLRDCYERSDLKGKKEFVKKLAEYKKTIEEYLNRFIFDLKKDVEDKAENYVDNEEEFIEWVENNIKRYKQMFLKNTSTSASSQGSS